MRQGRLLHAVRVRLVPAIMFWSEFSCTLSAAHGPFTIATLTVLGVLPPTVDLRHAAARFHHEPYIYDIIVGCSARTMLDDAITIILYYYYKLKTLIL